jgi:hypothetical protein
MSNKQDFVKKILNLLDDILSFNGVLPIKEKKYNAFLVFASIFHLSKIEENKKIILYNFEKTKEIYADLSSSLEFAGCSCRYKVINYIFNNWEKCIDIFSNILALQNENVLAKLYEMQLENWEKFLHEESKKPFPTPTTII